MKVISSALPGKSNLVIDQAAASAEDDVERHADRRDQQGQADRGERVGLDDRVAIGGDALAERFGEDRDEREQQDDAEEGQADRDQGPFGETPFAGGAAHASSPCRRAQAWSRLIRSSSRNEMMSMTVAIAVAPP